VEHGEPLGGGLANAGSVVRRGDVVVRPAPAHAAAIHAFLRRLRRLDFPGAPVPRRLTGEWEELEFIAGEVAVAPYPPWSLTDDALASVGRLLRRYHDAAGRVPVDGAVSWPRDLADPNGGPLLCHNDVCIENVVFAGGHATAVLDFDFAAPGRPAWDLAMTARYWVPVLDPRSAAVSGRAHLDPVRRLRLLVDAYGLAAGERPGFMAVLELAVEVARGFVAARVAAGEQGFVEALDEHGGWERWDRLQAWLAASRDRFTHGLCEGPAPS
jgi:aminoglycoside phosphotransferase (APT) family kinase protein